MCRSRGTSWLEVGGLKSMETGMGMVVKGIIYTY